jgi:hypothetical protein
MNMSRCRLRAGDSVLLCFYFKLPRVFLHHCLEGASFVHGGFSHYFCEKDPFVTPNDVVRTDWGLLMTVIPFLSFLQGSFAPMGNGGGGKKSRSCVHRQGREAESRVLVSRL